MISFIRRALYKDSLRGKYLFNLKAEFYRFFFSFNYQMKLYSLTNHILSFKVDLMVNVYHRASLTCWNQRWGHFEHHTIPNIIFQSYCFDCTSFLSVMVFLIAQLAMNTKWQVAKESHFLEKLSNWL